MFNAYCGSLDSFFAQMVSYGILKAADAQCFSVQGAIDPGSIALLVAAIILAVVSSVVSLASKQCLEDCDSTNEKRSDQIAPETGESLGVEKCPNIAEENNEGDTVEEIPNNSKENNEEPTKMTDIRSPPFLFTDLQGWLLTSTKEKSGIEDV